MLVLCFLFGRLKQCFPIPTSKGKKQHSRKLPQVSINNRFNWRIFCWLRCHQLFFGCFGDMDSKIKRNWLRKCRKDWNLTQNTGWTLLNEATYGKMLDKFLSYPCWWIKKSKMAFCLQSNLTKCFCFILAADPSTLNVRNFTYNSLNLSTVRIKWEKPIFSESNVTKYDLKYKRRGNPERKKAFHFEIEEVRPEKVLHTWTDKSGKLPSMLSSQYFGKNFGKRLGNKQTGP